LRLQLQNNFFLRLQLKNNSAFGVEVHSEPYSINAAYLKLLKSLVILP